MTKKQDVLRLAMLGMVQGNGHPYSWSAIINGRYDPATMAHCGYPVIPQYLSENARQLGIPGAQVTHVWTDDPADAEKVAKAAFIENIVADPTDVIGQVDGVLIATDIGCEHLDRAKPFIQADIPTFIDKPLTDNAEDLRTFIEYYNQAKPILSTSCMRYARELADLKTTNVGQPRLATAFTPKSWATYGIHALEGLYQITGPGFKTVRDVGTVARHTVMLEHDSLDAVVWAYHDAYGGFGTYQLIGTEASAFAKFTDTFTAFKTQLETFVQFIRTAGQHPFPPAETFELIAIIVAAIESRKRAGRPVPLDDIVPSDCLLKTSRRDSNDRP